MHKDLCHPGQHEGIIEAQLFEAVQAGLAGRTSQRQVRTGTRAILSGILFDASGRRMSPIHARNRHGQSYRYYTSASLLTGAAPDGDTRRVSAPALEEALLTRLRRWSGRTDACLQELRPHVNRISLHDDHIDVSITVPELENWNSRIVEPDKWVLEGRTLTVRSPLRLRVRGGRTFAIEATRSSTRRRPDRALLAGLKRAHAELQARGIDLMDHRGSQADSRGLEDPYLRKLTTLAFLAPDIQQAIISGQQPADLTLAGLLATRLPVDWESQRRLLGFSLAGPVATLIGA